MTSRHFPSPVTTMVSRRIRPGREADYEMWLKRAAKVARTFPGHQGVTFLGPQGPPPVQYLAIFTFDSSFHLQRWMASSERAALLKELAPMALDDGEIASLTGLEAWFVLPDRAVNQAPPRWKMALLTAAGVWPLLSLVTYLSAPVAGGWPVPLRIGASLLLGIPIMTWVVMPALTRLCFRWLYPEPRRPLVQGAAAGDVRGTG